MTVTVIDAPARTGRPGRPAQHPVVVAGLAVAAVVVVALSVFVGARAVAPSVLLDPADPLYSIYQARLERTLLGARRRRRTGPGRCLHAGTDPQPAGRPRHPRRQRGRDARDGAGDLVPRGLGPAGLPLVRVLGAAVAAVVVHAIASLGRDGATPVKLAIAGAALSPRRCPAGPPGSC